MLAGRVLGEFAGILLLVILLLVVMLTVGAGHAAHPLGSSELSQGFPKLPNNLAVQTFEGVQPRRLCGSVEGPGKSG
jgi:hypothetical protein